MGRRVAAIALVGFGALFIIAGVSQIHAPSALIIGGLMIAALGFWAVDVGPKS